MTKVVDLNLRHLHALTVAWRCGGISAASARINLSQPALTQAIGKLESQLDMTLLERQPGGIIGTEAMMLFGPRIERAVSFIARGAHQARRSQRLPAIAGLERRITLRQLRALDAVDATGSFSLAASRLGVSQPAVYRAVQELAELLDIPLTIRRGKRVQTTPAATRMLRMMRLAAAELSSGLEELEILRSRQGGGVTIGVMPLSRAILLPQVLSRFARAHPTATVNAIEGPYSELLNDLRDGSLDLIIGALRHRLPTQDVVQERLFDDDPVIVARSDHPLADGLAHFEQLLDYPWVMAARGAPVRASWEQMFRDHGHAPPALRIECGSVLITRGLLLEDDWLTLMSRDQFLLEQRAGLLCEVGAVEASARRHIGLTQRVDWHPTALQSSFVDFLRQVCRERTDKSTETWPFRYPESKA